MEKKLIFKETTIGYPKSVTPDDCQVIYLESEDLVDYSPYKKNEAFPHMSNPVALIASGNVLSKTKSRTLTGINANNPAMALTLNSEDANLWSVCQRSNNADFREIIFEDGTRVMSDANKEFEDYTLTISQNRSGSGIGINASYTYTWTITLTAKDTSKVFTDQNVEFEFWHYNGKYTQPTIE